MWCASTLVNSIRTISPHNLLAFSSVLFICLVLYLQQSNVVRLLQVPLRTQRLGSFFYDARLLANHCAVSCTPLEPSCFGGQALRKDRNSAHSFDAIYFLLFMLQIASQFPVFRNCVITALGKKKEKKTVICDAGYIWKKKEKRITMFWEVLNRWEGNIRCGMWQYQKWSTDRGGDRCTRSPAG